jgi:uncharacterized protein
MTRQLQASRLNMQAFAQQGEALVETTPLHDLHRLTQEAHRTQDAHDAQTGSVVKWRALGELREHTGAEADVWLRLEASTSIALTCQRCMQAVLIPLEVDQWYRFVATEDIAMAEDDASEEDLLVMEPQFDLLALLEDELLMALPLVPMHEQCPASLSHASPSLKEQDEYEPAEKPNPFAVLAQLKKK